MTPTQPLIRSRTLPMRAALVLGGTAVLAAASQISVPMLPVPMTLQTLAVLAIGMSFGARMGTLTVAAWLAEGAMGLPVFANGASSAAFFGPTAGFLWGFLAMVWVAGLAADRGLRSVWGLSLAGIVAGVLLYVPGLAWPALVMGKSVPDLISGWMAPFLLGDAVKAVLAALLVSGGWSLRPKR